MPTEFWIPCTRSLVWFPEAEEDAHRLEVDVEEARQLGDIVEAWLGDLTGLQAMDGMVRDSRASRKLVLRESIMLPELAQDGAELRYFGSSALPSLLHLLPPSCRNCSRIWQIAPLL